MEKYKFDENNGLWYELQGDYYLPCLKRPEEEQAYIGIWGQRHLRYLKEHRRVRYANLLTSGELSVKFMSATPAARRKRRSSGI